MKATKTILLVAGIIGLLFGRTLTAWAGGTPAGGGDPSCQVSNLSQRAIPLRGTAAVEALTVDIDTSSFIANVDLTLRLERGGAIKSFRLNDPDTNIFGKSNEEIACLFLENASFAESILDAFGLSKNTKLVITNNSISKAELQGPDQVIGTTGRSSSIADITIYAQ